MTEQPGNPTDPTQPDPAASSDAAPTPPPAAPTSPPAPPAQSGTGYQFDADKTKTAFQGAHKFDLGIIAAGIVAFFAGFMPFYTLSVGGFGGGSENAWHGFFGWFGVLCALAGAVIVALSIMGVSLPVPTRLAALAAFGVATICLILALFVTPLPSCGGLCNEGHGFGYWLALIVVLAGLALAALRYRETEMTTA